MAEGDTLEEFNKDVKDAESKYLQNRRGELGANGKAEHIVDEDEEAAAEAAKHPKLAGASPVPQVDLMPLMQQAVNSLTLDNMEMYEKNVRHWSKRLNKYVARKKKVQMNIVRQSEGWQDFEVTDDAGGNEL